MEKVIKLFKEIMLAILNLCFNDYMISIILLKAKLYNGNPLIMNCPDKAHVFFLFKVNNFFSY
jgi:hypothetical protein